MGLKGQTFFKIAFARAWLFAGAGRESLGMKEQLSEEISASVQAKQTFTVESRKNWKVGSCDGNCHS